MIDGKIAILLVDDHDFVSDSLERLVKVLCPDTVVHSANDGIPAWDMINGCKNGGYDLVITDTNMKSLHGPELVRMIRAAGETIHQPSIVAVSALDAESLYAGFGNTVFASKSDLSADFLCETVGRIKAFSEGAPDGALHSPSGP